MDTELIAIIGAASPVLLLLCKHFLLNRHVSQGVEKYYVMDAGDEFPINRRNRLSKSRKVKKGGTAYNYRKRTGYKFLFFGADTNENVQLGIAKCMDRIRFSLEKKKNCSCEIKMRATKEDIIKEIAAHHPDVLHFAGHGDNEGRLLLHAGVCDTEFISPRELFANLSACCGFVQIVVIAACHSYNQAKEVARYVDVVIGMEGEIAVDAVESFCEIFYMALIGGSSVYEAYGMGIAQLRMGKAQYADRPRLVVREGLRAKDILLMPSSSKAKKED